MNNPRPFVLALLLVGIPSLGACSNPTATDPAETRTEASVVESIKDARRDVRKHVNERNIKLSADDDSLPGAEITPAGDLLVGGKKVAVDANQRALLMQYRGQVAAIAGAGAEIGLQGAELATKAMGEAFRSAFSGDTAGMEKRIEAEAEKIEAQALLLCDRMPAMLATQQALSEALPEFRPYATMDADDVGDCRDGTTTASKADIGHD